MPTTVPDQIALPVSAAFEVVMQGIRIRLGRALVTLTGVICGIAFLMSVLTGQTIKAGVAREDAIRAEVTRIRDFMRADLPDLAGKSVTVLAEGPLGEIEVRVMESLARDGVSSLFMEPESRAHLPPGRVGVGAVPDRAMANRSDVLLAMGASPLRPRDWPVLVGAGYAATTIPGQTFEGVAADRVVLLTREMTPEERDAREAAVRQERFRGTWIAAISLLVTVIGIGNAMLMSVTERFREIGTMKCLGALSAFIRSVFVLESALMGLLGGIAGSLAGCVFPLGVYALNYGIGPTAAAASPGRLLTFGAVCTAAGVLLSVLAALYPARVAARMVPAHALRSNV